MPDKLSSAQSLARAAIHTLLAQLTMSAIVLDDGFSVTARDDVNEAKLFLAPRKVFLPCDNLTESETNILEALGAHRMNARSLAAAAGYRLNSHFRSLLATLRQRGLLNHDRHGYFRPPTP